MATAVAVAGLAIGAASSVASSRQQSKARKAQKKAQKVQGRKADLENARTRRQQIVQSRRARATAISEAENQGIGGGSQISGVTSSIQSQAAGNVSFLNQLQGFDNARFSTLEDANKALGKASTFQAIGGLGFQAAGNADTIASALR